MCLSLHDTPIYIYTVRTGGKLESRKAESRQVGMYSVCTFSAASAASASSFSLCAKAAASASSCSEYSRRKRPVPTIVFVEAATA